MIKIEELSYNDEIVLTIGLDENDESIILVDKHCNTIRLGANGISFESPKDINLKADGNINIAATSNLTMKAIADATLDGLSITQSADTSFTAKGNSSAELSASGQTTVKGAMVMIN